MSAQVHDLGQLQRLFGEVKAIGWRVGLHREGSGSTAYLSALVLMNSRREVETLVRLGGSLGVDEAAARLLAYLDALRRSA